MARVTPGMAGGGEKLIVEALARVGVLVPPVGEINAGDHELVGGNGPVGFEGFTGCARRRRRR